MAHLHHVQTIKNPTIKLGFASLCHQILDAKTKTKLTSRTNESRLLLTFSTRAAHLGCESTTPLCSNQIRLRVDEILYHR
jgi:hypothetical protein